MSTIASIHDLDRAKRIRIYRNGDATFFGKDLVVNRRQMRTFQTFLTIATNHINMPETIRDIRTPRGKTIIRSIEELDDRREYVAVGRAKFKDIDYGNLKSLNDRKIELRKRHRENMIRLPQDVNEYRPSRYEDKQDRIKKDVRQIMVYVNGDEYEAAKKIVVTSRMLTHWDYVLNEIEERVKPYFGAITGLYMMDGTPVENPELLKSGHFYVAVGRYGHSKFKRVDYGGKQRNFVVTAKLPPRPFDTLNTESRAEEDILSPHEASPRYPSNTEQDNYETGGAVFIYADGGTVFPLKARKVRRKKKTKKLRKTRPSGVFTPVENRVETEGAEEVNESLDERVSEYAQPVDTSDARQVDEEQQEDVLHIITPRPPSKPRDSDNDSKRSFRSNHSRLSRSGRISDSADKPDVTGDTSERENEDTQADGNLSTKRSSGSATYRATVNPTGETDDPSAKQQPDSEINPDPDEDENHKINGSYVAYYEQEQKRKDDAARKIQERYKAHKAREQRQREQQRRRQEQEEAARPSVSQLGDASQQQSDRSNPQQQSEQQQQQVPQPSPPSNRMDEDERRRSRAYRPSQATKGVPNGQVKKPSVNPNMKTN